MTIAELFQELKSIGLPAAYFSFPPKQAPPPPFIIYLFTHSIGFSADNQNHIDVNNFRIELYSEYKDLGSERLVQDKLKELRLPYHKTETHLETEDLYQIIYDIKILGA